MQISLLLMEEIAKLFAIMLMGYAVVKAGLMKSSESKSISVVMVYLVIPCVIIDAFQVDYTADVKKGLLLACVAAVLVHVLFLILTTILKQVLKFIFPLVERISAWASSCHPWAFSESGRTCKIPHPIHSLNHLVGTVPGVKHIFEADQHIRARTPFRQSPFAHFT